MARIAADFRETQWIARADPGHDGNVPHSVSYDRVLQELRALREVSQQLSLRLDALIDEVEGPPAVEPRIAALAQRALAELRSKPSQAATPRRKRGR